MYCDLAESSNLVRDQSNLLIIKSKMQMKAPMVEMMPWSIDISFSFHTYCFNGLSFVYPKRAKSFLLRNRLQTMFANPKHKEDISVMM